MFVYRYFKAGFNFPKLLTIKGEPLYKVLIYFIFLTLIANFPLTWLAYENSGSKLNFIHENITNPIPNWDNLPNASIKNVGGLLLENNELVILEHNNYRYVFGDTSNYSPEKGYHTVIFLKDYIKYYDNNLNTLESKGYSGFTITLKFNEINLANNDDKIVLYKQFGEGIEKSFSNYIVLYTVIRNQMVQTFATIIMVLFLSLIIQLFRFAHSNFLSYKDGLNFVFISSTLPSILSMIFGVILPGFAPLVFNLTLSMIVMIVLLVYSRKLLA